MEEGDDFRGRFLLCLFMMFAPTRTLNTAILVEYMLIVDTACDTCSTRSVDAAPVPKFSTRKKKTKAGLKWPSKKKSRPTQIV